MPESAVAPPTLAGPTLTAPKLVEKLEASRVAARVLAQATTAQQNRALHAIRAAILPNAARILPANELDLANARDHGMSDGMQDRLRLDYRRLEALEAAVLHIATLDDPVGETVRGSTLPNGLAITQV